ncbi:Transient receptor potential channel Flc/Pkd2-like protein [Pleurotus pulmonarius]
MKTTSLSLFMNLLTFLFFSAVVVQADPASLPFTDCFSGDGVRKLTVSTVYGQVVRGIDGQSKTGLNLTIFGENPQEIVGSSSSSLSTLFTATTVLTLGVFSNATWFCNPLRPPNAQPLPAENASYCPLAAGPFAFGSPVIWGDNRDLTTLTTRLRAVDESSNELICLDVSATPLEPTESSPYGEAVAIFWMTVGLALAYWLVVGIARIASAWNRGVKRPDKGIWSRAQSAGFILASAISGERLATSPALLRFCTPSLRDIFFHTQWCAVLAMVAVEWPQFVYPLLTQTAWSTLTYNITVTSSGAHWDPLSTQPFNPPASFAAQTSDPSSPLYIDPTIPNVLFTLPANASHGMESFAYAVGVRPQDLFSICLVLFLGIIGGTIVISFFVWLVDYIALFFVRMVAKHGPSHPRLAGARSPGYTSKDLLDASSPVPMTGQNLEDNKSLTGHAGNGLFSPPSRFGLSTTSGKGFWRSHFHIRKDINSFHGSVLQGNLVRVLVIFHLPITIFSCYQMTLRHTRPDIPTPMSSVILAALAFAFLSLLIPAFLVVRVTMTTTNKLYDETRTLLSLGPLYNHYRHGSQMFASLLFASNIAFGVAIGCGQNSGTAQAIVILVIEVVSALVTSIWLPWGTGASMGLISFLFCVARIVVAVLLVILTPTISIGRGPGAWVSYGILVILALVYLALVAMLLVKLLEATIRIFGRIPFDRSTHVVDSGLLGACGLLGCCGPRRRRRRRPRRNRYKAAESARSEGATSERSSYMPPNVLGAHDDGTGSRKGSMHSGQPPSVLKPEQALRPYKEDSDDENGYIMGAWQPFPRPGYSTLRDTPSPAVNKPSGFSRVGGGRAHIDSPYAITASGSTHTFPSSSSPQNAAAGSALPVFDDDDSPPPSLSNVARYQDHALPPGAMQPISHIRTKSQTAIIEDASALVLTVPSSSKNPMDDDDEDSDTAQPKKKPWYHIRRHRPHSSDGTPSRDPPPDEESAPDPLSSQAAPGRSFVVIRKPQSSPHRLNALASGSAPSSGPNTPNVGSFGQNSANARAHNATA